MHEFASITTGSLPPSVQRSIAAIVRPRIASSAAVKPFEPNGTPQQWPATSSGIHTGMPARALTRTSASGSGGPKIRLMHAGR